MTDQQHRAYNEALQAAADYAANVPNAYDRYCYWRDELKRLLEQDRK